MRPTRIPLLKIGHLRSGGSQQDFAINVGREETHDSSAVGAALGTVLVQVIADQLAAGVAVGRGQRPRSRSIGESNVVFDMLAHGSQGIVYAAFSGTSGVAALMGQIGCCTARPSRRNIDHGQSLGQYESTVRLVKIKGMIRMSEEQKYQRKG